jgi:pimeloyl-ACP methyl ester carboxylesterase
LIQGMAGHHLTWGEPLVSRLGEDFDVVAYDHRGIGESTDLAGPFTIADLADDAAALLDHLGWPTAHVLGISLGGMVAQELVLARPERVRTLSLGCTYAGGAGSSLEAPGPLRMLEAMNGGGAEAAVRATYEANLSAAFREDAARFDEFRAMALSVTVPVELVLRQAQAAFTHDTSARLPSVTTPTLVLYGTDDEMLSPANSEQIARLIPGARLHSFPRTGHLFWWEHPELTARLLREHCLSG